MAKNYDFTFFLKKICITFKLRQNAAIIFFITPITLFQQYLVLPEKMQIKMLRF